MVEIMLAAGKPDEARSAAEELAAIASQHDTEVLHAMADHALGAVALAAGDAEAALQPLRRAFSVWHRLDAPYLSARIRMLVGRACEALGDREGAALEWAAARSVFELLGAGPDLAKLDAAPDRGAARGTHGLTQRELQVLKLIAAGKTNKAIARSLELSEKTVDRHVSNIFVKIDVPSRAAATAFAYEHKLI
jgi:DNA-binding NarL/FixJ family response regulator